MLRKTIDSNWVIFLAACFAIMTLGISGCGSSDSSVAHQEAAETTGGNSTDFQLNPALGSSSGSGIGQSTQPPPVQPGQSLNAGAQQVSLTPPDGQPEEILAWVQQVESVQPQGTTEAEALEHFKKIHRARIEGCEKILANNQAAIEVRMTAVQTKVEALRMLDGSSVEGARGELVEFASQLTSDQNTEISRLGKLMTFGFQVDDYAEGRIKDFSTIQGEITALLADQTAHPYMLDLGQQIASVLYSKGEKDNARRVLIQIGQAIKSNPDLADAGDSMMMRANLIGMDFEAKMQAALSGNLGADRELLNVIKGMFGDNEAPAALLDIVAGAAQNLETGGNYRAANEIFSLIRTRYQSHSNTEVAQNAVERADSGLRRTGLVGKPFQVIGITVDGQPFDWNRYTGKVVLIDFWATWCHWCLQEFPNLEKNYQAFRDKGFEVVGINLDDDRAAVDQFFSNRQLQWPTVLSNDPDAQGLQSPLAKTCGIEYLPFVVLVDRQGTVVALNLRGDQLEKKLTEMLGPPSLSSNNVDSQSANGQSANGQNNPLR